MTCAAYTQEYDLTTSTYQRPGRRKNRTSATVRTGRLRHRIWALRRLRRSPGLPFSSPLGVSFKRVVSEDLGDGRHLFASQRRRGLVDPPDVLVVHRRAERVVQVRDRVRLLITGRPSRPPTFSVRAARSPCLIRRLTVLVLQPWRSATATTTSHASSDIGPPQDLLSIHSGVRKPMLGLWTHDQVFRNPALGRVVSDTKFRDSTISMSPAARYRHIKEMIVVILVTSQRATMSSWTSTSIR